MTADRSTGGRWAYDACTELYRKVPAVPNPVALQHIPAPPAEPTASVAARPPGWPYRNFRDEGPAVAEKIRRRGVDTVPLLERIEEQAMTTASQAVKLDEDRVRLNGERAKSQAAFLSQSPTTTPSFPNDMPSGAVPTLRPNPGMLRALLQPILFFTLTEPLDAYEAGDTVALQFWGEGRVMVTPLPAAAARGRIPTTFPANKIHGYVAVVRHE